jgi:hypothetical protein
MALTPEQQTSIEYQQQLAIAQALSQTELEKLRHENQMVLQAKQTKLEAVRLAKETLLENARSKPVDSREVTAADIASFASALEAHINA